MTCNQYLLNFCDPSIKTIYLRSDLFEQFIQEYRSDIVHIYQNRTPVGMEHPASEVLRELVLKRQCSFWGYGVMQCIKERKY